MNPLRILVADDHEIVRRGLVSLLKSHPRWEVCAEAQDGELQPRLAQLSVGALASAGPRTSRPRPKP